MFYIFVCQDHPPPPQPICSVAVMREVSTYAPLSLTKRRFSTPTQNTLMEIVERLENHPQEVVILVCRNFDGMMEDLHKYLMGCIKNISGDMCPCKVSRDHRLPMLMAVGAMGALGVTVIKLSARCMRMVQALGDVTHRTPRIHPPLSPHTHPNNQLITFHRQPQ